MVCFAFLFSDQVANLKEKIQDARDDLVAERQKLIHSGKVLKDEQTVQELGLSESDFLVCMVTKEVKVSVPVTPFVLYNKNHLTFLCRNLPLPPPLLLQQQLLQ